MRTAHWWCHPDGWISPIGAVGSTGNVMGSHLHLEVRPGGGEPVDPSAAFIVHGITP